MKPLVRGKRVLWAASLGALVVLALVGGRRRGRSAIGALATSVGDLQTMHADVSLRGKTVVGGARLAAGDEVETGPAGRARVRLDDGTQAIVDADTKVSFAGGRLALAKGRVFVQGGASARTEVAFGDATATVVSSAAAFDARASKVFCVRGEISLVASGKPSRVPSGETATLAPGASPVVAPEAAFDDWTGGLATPWAGEKGPASAIPELWSGADATEPGAPLVVRAANVDVEIEGEVARTRMRVGYFNGSDRGVTADVRMALPEGAIVSRVARLDEGAAKPVEASVGSTLGRPADAEGGRLEWAGAGFLRGVVRDVAPGKSVELAVDYVEWLAEAGGHATYRLPMASAGDAPPIGNLAVRVESVGKARWISSSSETTLRDGAIELRGADVRPTGDLVVELAPEVVREGAARAYVERAEGAEDPWLLVRTEVPEVKRAGASFALVVDASMSVGASLLETERAVVDAILEALGPNDEIVVLVADEDARVVGPEKPAAVTPATRKAIRDALAGVRAGGASNLGAALEAAADRVDAGESAAGRDAIVVYVGDARPTVGETTARELRRRLARRAGGVPRLAAVAVGQGADRWMLAELVQRSGPTYEVADRLDAARAGGALVAEALAPMVRDVSLDLGPTVDRVYPREPRALASGTTFAATGRLRGALPERVTLRYRRGAELVEESRPLARPAAPAAADVAKRWAQDRVEEISSRGEGLEGAVALAANAGLLTPFTSFFFERAGSSPWDARVLGLDPARDVAYAARVAPSPPPPSLVAEPPRAPEGTATVEVAAAFAARKTLRGALPALVACRDARAAVRPDVASELSITVAIDTGGRATKVVVRTIGGDDVILGRCARGVVEASTFVDAGVAVSITERVELPPLALQRRTRCSTASTLPLAVKRGVWRARKASLDYMAAARQCELPTWADRRALLAVAVSGRTVDEVAALASKLAALGEVDAASFVRQELLRRHDLASLSAEALRRLFVGDEPRVDVTLDAAYRAAKSDADRLVVLRRFLRLAPHSPLGRRLLLELLESRGEKDALKDEIARVRADPFADAGLLASAASALLRLGDAAGGRRAFGELVERAPRDPWTLAFVGDRLRGEGLFDGALASYERLDATTPDDPAVALRLALAHAGAGRLDVAVRLLTRAAETGGRGDDGRTGELASIVAATLLADAQRVARTPETAALLARRLAETPLPDVASVVLVRAPPGDAPIEVRVSRDGAAREGSPADLDAPSIGLSALRLERGSGGATRIRLSRPSALAGARAIRATVDALVLAADRGKSRLVTREVDVDDKPVELSFDGETLR